MNFLFVDRILELIPGQRTLALKHVTASDVYLTEIPQSGQAALISCVIGEAIGQLCSWNVIQSSEFRLRLIGGVVGEVAIHDFAYVGETLILENTIDTLDFDNQVVSFHGRARVGDRLILEVRQGLGPLLALENFSDPAQLRKEFNTLYRPGPIPQIAQGRPITHKLALDSRHVSYDRILNWETGRHVTAQKNISLSAPYLADHFPRRPVLPLSLLLESKLQLAQPFLSEFIGTEKAAKLRPVAVRRIKMNDFVEPGAMVITHMQLKEHTEHRFLLTFRSEVEGKRVCTCEAEFAVNL